jgi:hypothetical protein
MPLFLLYSKTAWNDYFTGTYSINLNSQTFTSRQTLSDTSIYISNCLFRSITSTSGNGGALLCTSVTYFLVESSSFFSCKTSSGYGGAIYFDNTNNGQSVLHEVCGYDCYTTYTSSYYQFAFLRVYNTASSKNYFNYSSISRCVNAESNSHYNLRLRNGKICCPSVNISLNKCQYYSGIYCNPLSDLNSVTCSFSCSTFVDNTANGHNCIRLATTANYEIKSCNILRNIQISLGSEGTIASWGNLAVEDSCILENTANCIFYQGSSYTITISNCTVDSNSKTGNVVTRNTVTKSFILALKHMSTQNCHSEYDSAGYLTPIIQTPSSSKKQKVCYTYVKLFYQSPLSGFILLTFVSSVLKILPQ